MKKSSEKSIFENIWVTRILSLLVSLLLFSYVYSENYGLSTTNQNDAISTTRRETISNLPIEINMDTDRYFISGLPETVVLSLSGPESVIVQTLSASDFNIVTEDLDLLGPGRHTVQLRAENISDELDYQITPSRVNVEIEEKVSIESPIEVLFDASAVDEQYIAGDPILSTESVTLTGPSSTIDRIERIYVRVPAEGNLTNDIQLSTVVQVEDANGNKLNVTIEPQQVDVRIPIDPYEKTVPIKIVEKGTPVAGKDYELTVIGDGQVTLTGSRTLLADVDEVAVEVDISGVRADTVLTVPINASIPTVTVTPVEVQVNVKVSDTRTENTNNRSDKTTKTDEKESKDDE